MRGRTGYVILAILVISLAARWWYFRPTHGTGDRAPNFSAVRLDGTSFELEVLRGQPVLLDFWGSWCGPCRREAPHLRRIQASHPELTIVSVALEQDSSRWLRALEQDGRNWPYQVMETTNSLRFLNGPVADLYGVNQVPTAILLDETGTVVATGSEAAAVLDKLR